MVLKIHKIILILLFFIVLPIIAKGKEHTPAIEYVYPDQSVWTTKLDAKGKLANPLLYYAEEVFSRMQMTWTAKAYPAERMFQLLENGFANFSILVKASRLKDACIFSNEPVAVTELRVYRKTSSSAIRRKEDLLGKSVILIEGYSYGSIGKYLRDPANKLIVNESSKHGNAFQMLHLGRAEYLLDYSGPSEEVLEMHPQMEVTHDTLDRLNVYFVLSKSYPDALGVMKTLEATAASIDIRQWGLQRP